MSSTHRPDDADSPNGSVSSDGQRAPQESGSAGLTAAREFVAEVAAPVPTVTGGGASAVTVATAAGLIAMTARISSNAGTARFAPAAEKLRERAMELAEADPAAYADVLVALRRDRDDPGRGQAVAAALEAAADPPCRITETAREVAETAREITGLVKPSLRGDTVSAASLAAGAAQAAAYLARVNLDAAGADPEKAARVERAALAAQHAAEQAREPAGRSTTPPPAKDPR